ncbi:MAG: hypothetical protein AAGJ86_11450 [Pseudomonadota bacterium]
MSSLTLTNDDTTSASTDEQQRLLELFSNRVALKKSYADLRAERRLLEERLAEARRENDGLQARVDYLESLLSDREQADAALLYFQLGGVWQRATDRLRLIVAESTDRIEGANKARALADWNAEQRDRIDRVATKIEHEHLAKAATQQRLESLRDARYAARRAWWFWRRRRLDRELVDVRDELAARDEHLDALIAHHRQLESAVAPLSIGLSVADKRKINFEILAWAQLFCAQLAGGDLLHKMRLATERELGAVDFGDQQSVTDCLATVRRREARLIRNMASKKVQALIARQVAHLGIIAGFESDHDAIPSDFVGQLHVTGETDSPLVVDNALAAPDQVIRDDLFALSTLLLR